MNYDPVLEVIAHGDEALIFFEEGYDPSFVITRARAALFQVEATLRDWEPTFRSDGIQGAQLRNRLLSLRADLRRIPQVAGEQIADNEAAKNRGEGVTYGEFLARGGVRALNTAAEALKGAGENIGKFGPMAIAAIVIAFLIIRKFK